MFQDSFACCKEDVGDSIEISDPFVEFNDSAENIDNSIGLGTGDLHCFVESNDFADNMDKSIRVGLNIFSCDNFASNVFHNFLFDFGVVFVFFLFVVLWDSSMVQTASRNL